MNILPKVGIDNIRLGMNQKQVIELLGKAAYIQSELDNDCWNYELGMELSFSKDNLFLLGSITVTNPSALLKSKRIIGLSEKEFLENFPFFKLDEDFGENGKDYICPSRELSVWVSEGAVTNVTVFPEYDVTGEVPLWPQFGT